MSSRYQEQLEARLRDVIAAHGEPEPQWAAYPWIRSGSIGWRMGVGESHAMLVGHFVRTRIASVDEAIAYLARHPKAPRTWRRSVSHMFRHLDSAALEPRLEAAAVVGDDVAYPVFVRNAERTGGMTAPWTWRGAETPAYELRYAARELGWWARWLATSCADRGAWLAAQPLAPSAWEAVATLITARPTADELARTAPNATANDQVAALIVHGGYLPPPWLAGADPLTEITWEADLASDRDRWAWWAFDTFDDDATWRAYLARWPPPVSWEGALDELFDWPA